MAAGVDGSWSVKTEESFPKEWSVTTGKNILWKTTLPEGGQSGIAVWENRLFLTINKPLPIDTQPADAKGADIEAYCLDATSGETLWTASLPGTKESGHSGTFSDASTPTPVTDGQHVWFINAGGSMACFEMNGQEVWRKDFEVRTKHAAKQAEPILYQNWLLYVTLLEKDDPRRRPMLATPGDKNSDPALWPKMFVRAFDKSTGKPVWSETVGTSVHNTPSVKLVAGQPYLYHNRGGGHRPPEQPYGVSLTKLGGDTLWNVKAKNPFSYTYTDFNEKYAYLINDGHLIQLSFEDGSEVARIPLFKDVTLRLWNKQAGQYEVFPKAVFSQVASKYKPYPTHQTTVLMDNYYFFLSHEGHCVVRVDTQNQSVEYLQLPTQVVRTPEGKETTLWGAHHPNQATNSRGMDVGSHPTKSRRDGWGHVTAAHPIVINDLIYFSTMIGMTYVIDSQAETWDETAIIAINDLGSAGETWTLSTPSYSRKRLYHRGLKYVVCIGENED